MPKTNAMNVEETNSTAFAHRIAYREALDHIGFHNVNDDEREMRAQQTYARKMCKKAFIVRKLREKVSEENVDN